MSSESSKKDIEKMIDEIVEKVSLVEEMKNKGVDVFELGSHRKAVCPFHGDTDPSFVLYEDDRPHAHCFGCGKHVDVFWFIHEWGKKYESDWDFKKTVRYFNNNYDIKSIGNPEEMDNSFLEEGRHVKEHDSSRETKGDYYLVSKIVRSSLQESPNPSFDLNKMKPFLRSLDDVFFSYKTPDISIKQEAISDMVDSLHKIRYPEEFENFSGIIYGDWNSDTFIISSEEDKDSIISGLLKIGGSGDGMLISCPKSDQKNGHEILKTILKTCRIKRCFVIGQSGIDFIFPESIKTIEEFSGKEKVINIMKREINFVFSEDVNKDILLKMLR